MTSTNELFAVSTIDLAARVIASAKDKPAVAELTRMTGERFARSSWLAREARKFLNGEMPKARLELHLNAAKGDAPSRTALHAAVGAERTKAKAAKAKAKAPAAPAMDDARLAAFTRFLAWEEAQAKAPAKAAKTPAKAPARRSRKAA